MTFSHYCILDIWKMKERQRYRNKIDRCRQNVRNINDWDRKRVDISLQWRHNERDGVSTHRPPDCVLNRLFRRRWTRTSTLRVTGFCEGNQPVTGELPAQGANSAEDISIWWRHYDKSTRDKEKFILKDSGNSWVDAAFCRGRNTIFLNHTASFQLLIPIMYMSKYEIWVLRKKSMSQLLFI